MPPTVTSGGRTAHHDNFGFISSPVGSFVRLTFALVVHVQTTQKRNTKFLGSISPVRNSRNSWDCISPPPMSDYKKGGSQKQVIVTVHRPIDLTRWRRNIEKIFKKKIWLANIHELVLVKIDHHRITVFSVTYSHIKYVCVRHFQRNVDHTANLRCHLKTVTSKIDTEIYWKYECITSYCCRTKI